MVSFLPVGVHAFATMQHSTPHASKELPVQLDLLVSVEIFGVDCPEEAVTTMSLPHVQAVISPSIAANLLRRKQGIHRRQSSLQSVNPNE